MEVSVKNTTSPLHGRRAVIAVALLLAAGLAVLAFAQRPQDARADANDNHTRCTGAVSPGERDPDDPDMSVVHYRLRCSNPISGFQIVPGKEIQGFETEVFATDAASGEVVQGDAFSCNGEIPGLGLNCVGAYSGSWHVVEGTFKIAEKLCVTPRRDRIKPLLTVMRATIDSKGNPAQSIAGPFRMSGPKGCPAKPATKKKGAKKAAAKKAPVKKTASAKKRARMLGARH
jgi:hypothetical protein